MSQKIKTRSNKADREIETVLPKILQCETLEELIKMQGEELCLAQIKSQVTIAFRSMLRGKLELTNEEGDYALSDKDIYAMDFTDWKPMIRTRKTAEEKALEILGSLSPEVRATVMASLKGK